MKAERVTEAMLPEFETTPEMERKFRAWSALRVLHNGASHEDVQLLYQMSATDLEPYEAEWKQMQANG